jgi:nucleoside-diphosphate-sugar epimerase
LLAKIKGVSMHSKKLVVTGGAGFIGSNLVEEFAKLHNVTVIDKCRVHPYQAALPFGASLY